MTHPHNIPEDFNPIKSSHGYNPTNNSEEWDFEGRECFEKDLDSKYKSLSSNLPTRHPK